jgi:O-antigen/teichoic acid export membrane protein
MSLDKLFRLRPRSEFGRHVFTMMSGATIGQVIPLIVAPLLTRLYTPEQFGVYAVFLGLASVLSMVATGRYEFAIVLPKDDADAMHIAVLALLITCAVSTVTLIAITIFIAPIAQLLGHPEQVGWLYLVPLMVLLLGCCQVLNFSANRHARYRAMALSAVAQQGITAGSIIALGVVPAATHGLVLGRLAGQFAGCFALLPRFLREDWARRPPLTCSRLAACASRFRQFPMFNVPYSLIGTFSKEFLVIALSSFKYLEAAGFYGLTRIIMYAPIGFISSSLGQVFFKEASLSMGTPRFEQLTLRLMNGFAAFCAPAFAFLVFWAPDVFAALFGERWRMSGVYAALLAPVGLLSLFTTWPERVFAVAQRQQVSLLVQVASDSASIALVWGLLLAGGAPLVCIGAFSLAQCVYHFVYLFAVFRTARFDPAGYWRLLRRIGKLLLFAVAAFMLVKILAPSKLTEFIISSFLMALYYLWLWRRMRRFLPGSGH